MTVAPDYGQACSWVTLTASIGKMAVDSSRDREIGAVIGHFENTLQSLTENSPMKSAGTWLKAFLIAIPPFIVHAAIALSQAFYPSSYEAGEIIGQVMFSYLMAAILTGVVGKFWLKRSSWLKTIGIYAVIVGALLGLKLLGGS
ncbi:MAG: hypothetical protein AAGG53_16985 [Cyanobacteria bacterium P01_H01_bin.152]